MSGRHRSHFGGSKTEKLGNHGFVQLILRETGETCSKAVSMLGRAGCETYQYGEGGICRIWVTDGIQGTDDGGVRRLPRLQKKRVTMNPEKTERRRAG